MLILLIKCINNLLPIGLYLDVKGEGLTGRRAQLIQSIPQPNPSDSNLKGITVGFELKSVFELRNFRNKVVKFIKILNSEVRTGLLVLPK